MPLVRSRVLSTITALTSQIEVFTLVGNPKTWHILRTVALTIWIGVLEVTTWSGVWVAVIRVIMVRKALKHSFAGGVLPTLMI